MGTTNVEHSLRGSHRVCVGDVTQLLPLCVVWCCRCWRPTQLILALVSTPILAPPTHHNMQMAFPPPKQCLDPVRGLLKAHKASFKGMKDVLPQVRYALTGATAGIRECPCYP